MAVELPTESRIVESRVANRQTSVMTDRWPRTRRPLPWLLALFLVLVYLVPIDVIQLPINLPVGSDLDRCVITFIVVIWLLVAAKRSGEVRLKRSAMNVGLYLFLVTCLLSVMVNLHSLNFSGELSLSVKQLALLFSYVALFYVTSSSVRPDEIESFARLIIGLGVITAIGTIYEFRSGTNLFFTLSHDVLGHLVPPAPKAHLSYEIAAVTGPTQHGLADGTIMGAGIPFAATFGTRPGDPRGRIKWLVAIILLVMGCVATQRKTALLVPIVSILVLVVMEPRRYLRYWPLLIVGLMAMEAIAPTAVSGLRYQFSITATSNATSGRTEDYAAVFPDIVNHLLFGRGYNSYYPIKYRFLDNQMLDFLIETGAFGLLSFIGLIASSAASVWREARHGTAQERTLMAPVVANAAMFFVTAFLYDVLGFRQAPYLFLFVAALGVAYVAPGRTASRTLVSASPTVTA